MGDTTSAAAILQRTLGIEDVSDFLVVDRGSSDANLEEADYPEPYAIDALA